MNNIDIWKYKSTEYYIFEEIFMYALVRYLNINIKRKSKLCYAY